ncbi:lipid II:glycine glycyltransferase FemX [Kineococcus sp. SYSU DK004]|uniref:lipid II:glycine glycyltransferase FemX n=1 Tax=Kineococcus sp. SYSU DK004 TaxID=3383125 RepID=UPI003D7D1608
MHVRRAADRAEWDGFLDGRAATTPFHRWDWLSTQAELHGWRFEPLVVERSGWAVGVVPLLLTRLGPVWRAAPVPFPYAGPVVLDGELGDVLAAVAGWSRRHGVVGARLDLPPQAAADPEVLRAAHASVELGETFVVDLAPGGVLQDEETALRQLHKSARRTLRHTERDGLRVEDAGEWQVVAWLPDLLEQVYAHHGEPCPYPPGVGRTVWQLLRGRPGAAHVRAAVTADGEPAGLLVSLAEGDTVYEWAGGSFAAGRRAGAEVALHADLVRWAVARGYRRIDLVGSVDEGVRRFKRSLGGRSASFQMASQSANPLWRAARQARELLPRAS